MRALQIVALAAAASLSAQPEPGDWLVVGDTAEPTSLLCTRPQERVAQQICRLVCDSLVDFDPAFRLIPRLAESYELSPDGKILTFRLHRGVVWHDGTPFTARDVTATIEAIRRSDPTGEAIRNLHGPLTKVVEEGEGIVRAFYPERYASALAGWRETFVMPAHLLADPARAPSLDRAPVGTGPFRFARWDPQQQIVLDANKAYFNGRPLIDRYVLKIVPNVEALRTAAAAGAVDVAPLTPAWAASHPDPDPNLPFRVIRVPTTSMEMIYWNLAEPRGLFSDPRVRRALTMLLDREGYATKIQHGFYRPATTLIDPAIWGGDPSIRPWPYDVEGAGRLLDEAGVKDRNGDGVRDAGSGPMSFTLLYLATSPSQGEIASLLERAAAKAGVRVALQGLALPMLREKLHTHQFEAVVYGFRLEPIADPYSYFHSSQIASGFNFGGYRNAEFDRLSEDLRRVDGESRRAEILRTLQGILHRDQPCTFVSVPGAVVAVHRRFRFPDVTIAGLWNWYPSVLRWWVPASDRRYR